MEKIRDSQENGRVRIQDYQLPANKYINQPEIQPIIEKENLKVQFVPGQDKVIDVDTI